MPNKRSLGKLESRLARKYVYQHCIWKKDGLRRNTQITECIFTGTEKAMRETVLAELKDKRSGEIPDYPQGLVISDSRGEGFFDLEKQAVMVTRF